MRTIDFDSYSRRERARFAGIRLSMTRPEQERVRRRPRDPGEMKALLILTRERFRRWQEDGRLKIISPREYLLR